MGLPSLTIAGFPVAGGRFGTHKWPVTFGLDAPEIVWTLDPELADAVLALKETSIVFTADDGKTFTVNRVVVVREAPAEDPLTRNVVLSDTRWYWPRTHVKRTYNARTRSGTARLNNPDSRPVQVADITQDIVFANYSLKGGVRSWKANEIAADLLDLVSPGWVNLSRPRPQLNPNDVFVDAPGNVAVGQAIGLMGGVDIYIDPIKGSAILTDRVAGAERSSIDRLMTYVVEGLHELTWVDMSHVAPATITGRVTRELEVRADFLETTPGSQSTRDPNDNSPTVYNVIQVTDQTLPGCSDPVTGKAFTAVQGMFVDIDSWFSAVAALGDAPSLPGAISRTIVCDGYLGPNLHLLYAGGVINLQPSYVWAARLGSVFRDFRRTFRLNRKFTERILPGSIRAVRAAMIDPATGTRQSSPVWADFCRRPTTRFLVRNNGAKLGWNMHVIPPDLGIQDVGATKAYGPESLPDNPVSINLMSQISPMTLDVVDPLTGVFRTDPKKDPFDQAAELIPSLVQKLPCVDPFTVATAGGLATWEQASLSYTHRVVFIFSCIPAGPNNEGQLHRYPVSAARALARLGVAPSAVSAKGPGLDLRVGANLVTARCAWNDADRQSLLACFDEAKGADAGQALVPVNDAEIRDYVESAAAVTMASLLDHYEGNATIGFEPGLVPIGSIQSVVHQLTGTGDFLTTVNAVAFQAPVRPEHFLSASSRASIMRQIGN